MNTLIQHGFGEQSAAQLRVVEAYHAELCRQHGWLYVCSYEPGDQWRFGLILQALGASKAGEKIVSADCDSVILQMVLDEAIDASWDAGLGQVGEWLHAGTLYLNNTAGARAYVERCQAASKHYKEGIPKFFTECIGEAQVKRLGPCWDDWILATGENERTSVVRSFHRWRHEKKMAGLQATVERMVNGDG